MSDSLNIKIQTFFNCGLADSYSESEDKSIEGLFRIFQNHNIIRLRQTVVKIENTNPKLKTVTSSRSLFTVEIVLQLEYLKHS